MKNKKGRNCEQGLSCFSLNARKKGQQEIVGFVLIVAVVVVALMVFLVISLKDSGEDVKSVEVKNMLDALMKQTTECAIVYEPDYDSFEDLFKSCYKNNKCKNLGVSACNYLNESLAEVLDAMFATEATISAHQLDFFVRDSDESQTGILRILEGKCAGTISSAQRSIVSGSDSLIIRLKVCTKA